MNAETSRLASSAAARLFVAHRARIAIRGVLFAAMLLGTGFSIAQPPKSKPATPLLNRRAPEIARADLNGKPVSLAGLRGKVVLLNFWATWCAPCQIEMPVFAAWQRQYGPQGLQIVGISMDDVPQDAQRLVRKLKLNYPVAMGDAALGERYGGVLGLPLTYVIDRHGIVRARFQGETDPRAIEEQLKPLLAHP